MAFELEHSSWSLVAVGNFNPSIFHPAWLALNDAASSVEADVAKIELVHPDLSSFSLAGIDWRVERERLTLVTSTSPEVRILDSVVRVLGSLLPHSPVTAFGINRSVHFSTGTQDQRTKFGRRLAPLEPWGKFGLDVGSGQDEQVGGVSSISMRSLRDTGDYKGHTEVTVQPSNVLKGNTGVFVSVNNHYEPKNDLKSAVAAARLLEFEFDKANDYSLSIIMDLIEASK